MMRKIKPKILRRFFEFLERGHGQNEGVKEFHGYESELHPYSIMISSFKKFKKVTPDENFCKETLKRVYINEKLDLTKESSYQARQVLSLARFKPVFLKPLIIFTGILIFFTFSFAGTIYASNDSVPGDALYSVKRASETIQVLITPYSGEGKLYAEFLNRRLGEADILFYRSETVDREVFEDLIKDIDHTYGMCKKYGCLDEDKDKEYGNRMRRIKETFSEKGQFGSNKKSGNMGGGKCK